MGMLNQMNGKLESSLVFHVHLWTLLKFILQVPSKGVPILKLWFLIRHTDMEPCNLNRICLWSDRKHYDETSHLIMFLEAQKSLG